MDDLKYYNNVRNNYLDNEEKARIPMINGMDEYYNKYHMNYGVHSGLYDPTYKMNFLQQMAALNANRCQCVKSYFRVLNALSNESKPDIDVYVNEMMMVSNLAYGDFTKYIKFAPGDYKITIYLSGDKEEPIIETNINIGRNLSYTGVVAGDLSEPDELSIFMIPEPKEKLMMNKMSALRMVNVSSDSPSLDLIDGNGTVLFSDIGFGDISRNIAIPSGKYTLHLRGKEDEKDLITASDVELAPKMHYTLFIIGNYGNSPRTELLIPEDGVNYLDIC